MKKRSTADGVKRAVIYIRYILPVILCVAMLISTTIPCLQYSTTEGTNDKISASELFENSWDQVRYYLFSGGQNQGGQRSFSQAMLVLLIILALLYVLGSISTVAVAICVLRFLSNPKNKTDTVRMWFITIVPNRIVVCICQALTLPLLFLSRLIAPMYDTMMGVDVLLRVSFPEPWVWGLIFFGATVALSVISARFEKKLGLDVFEKEKKPRRRADGKFETDSTSDEYVPSFSTEAEQREYEIRQKAKDEQAELIRKLLHGDEDK